MATASSGESDGIAELIALYAAEMPARIDCIKDAIAKNDRDQLKRLLHQLVGSAGSYGFNSLSVEARKVELALCGNASIAELSREIDAIIELCGRVSAE